MNSSQPLVSVIIPCYNHDQFVQDSIQSVIDQDYENIELIIIDDGSQDNSVLKIQEMMESCKKRFVRFEFRNRGNKGLSATLNEALEWCEGKYFSSIASDDKMLNYKTSMQVKYLEKHNESVAVFGAVQLIDENDQKLEKIASKARSYSFEDIIMHRHNLLAPTQMIRKKTIKDVGGYNANLFIEDWYMWLLLSREGEIFSMNETLALYRKHDSNISKNLVKMHEGRLKVLKEFQEYEYYTEAVKNTKWFNAVEVFMSSGKMKYYIKSFTISPLRTIKITCSYLNKRFRNAKTSVF